MKTLYKTVFLYIICISHNAYAVQNDPNIVLATEWFLHSLIIDGEEMTPPSNEEMPMVKLYFDIIHFPDEPTSIYTFGFACRSISGIGDVLSDRIIIFATPTPYIDCQLQENIDYDALYFNFLGSATEFPYELLTDGDNLQLILTAPNGYQAVYGNQTLSVQEVKTISFQVYPNPVQDFLYIIAPDVSIQEVSVYTSLGKEVKKGYSQEAIDVKGLSKGIYFVVITSDQGNIVKKIIIE